MRCALAVVLLLLLTACRPPVTLPCPEPPVVPNPVLRIHSLTPGSSVAQVLDAYVLDLAAVVGQRDQLQALLDAYRTKKETSK